MDAEVLAQAKEQIDKAIGEKADMSFVQKSLEEVKETMAKLEETAAKADWAKGIEDRLAEMQLAQPKIADTYLKGFEPTMDGKEVNAGPWGAVEGQPNVFEKIVHIRDEMPLNDALREKAALSNIGAPVNMTNAPTAYTEMQRGNEWEGLVDRMAVSAAVVPVLNVQGMGFVNEAAAPDNAAGSERGTEPTLSNRNTTIESYVMQVFMSEPSLLDNPGVQAFLEQRTMRAYGQQVGNNVHSSIVDASTAGSGAQPRLVSDLRYVRTGQASSLPQSSGEDDGQAIVRDLIRIARTTPKEYLPGAAFYVSPQIWGAATTAALEEFYHNPQTGLLSLAGYPFIRMDSFVNAAANARVAVFGNVRDAVFVADRETVSIRMYPQTKPGSVTFFARGRHCVPSLDPKALTYYVVAA